MDLAKLLQSLETLLFDVLLWIVLFPKTLLRVLTNPAWAVRYVDEQLTLEEKARFDDYMSPVAFFAVCVLMPFAVFMDRQASVGVGSVLPSGITTIQNQFLLTLWNSVTIALGFALATRGDKKPLITRTGLRQHFLTHCYVAGPMILVLNSSMQSSSLTERLMLASPFQSVLTYASLLSFVWFAWAESATLANATQVSRKRGLLLVAAGMGFWGILNLLWVAPLLAYALVKQ